MFNRIILMGRLTTPGAEDHAVRRDDVPILDCR